MSVGSRSRIPAQVPALLSSWFTAPRPTAERGSGCFPTSDTTTPSSPGTRRASGNHPTSTTPGASAQFADALAAFIDALGLERPHVVGHGEADARSPSNAEALHAAIPTSRLAVLAKLGHACVVENPETCATEIRHFVKNLS